MGFSRLRRKQQPDGQERRLVVDVRRCSSSAWPPSADRDRRDGVRAGRDVTVGNLALLRRGHGPLPAVRDLLRERAVRRPPAATSSPWRRAAGIGTGIPPASPAPPRTAGSRPSARRPTYSMPPGAPAESGRLEGGGGPAGLGAGSATRGGRRRRDRRGASDRPGCGGRRDGASRQAPPETPEPPRAAGTPPAPARPRRRPGPYPGRRRAESPSPQRADWPAGRGPCCGSPASGLRAGIPAAAALPEAGQLAPGASTVLTKESAHGRALAARYRCRRAKAGLPVVAWSPPPAHAHAPGERPPGQAGRWWQAAGGGEEQPAGRSS